MKEEVKKTFNPIEIADNVSQTNEKLTLENWKNLNIESLSDQYQFFSEVALNYKR